MLHHDADKLLVVMLDDMINHSLPRLICIRKHLHAGEVLADNDIHYLSSCLDRLSGCYVSYEKDEQCRLIFSAIAHLTYKIVKRALKNEKKMSKRLHHLEQQHAELSAFSG